MKKINNTRPATWLAGGAVALSASASDAALVNVEITDGSISLMSAGTTLFGNSVGLDAVLAVNFIADGGDATASLTAGGAFIARDLIDSYFLPNGISPEFVNSGRAGTAIGGGFEDLVGLSPVTLNLSAGGSVEGWLVSFNDNALFGDAGVTNFVYDDADLLNRNATVTNFTLADLDELTVVTTVAQVPEPSSLMLLALGAGGIMARRKRQTVA